MEEEFEALIVSGGVPYYASTLRRGIQNRAVYRTADSRTDPQAGESDSRVFGVRVRDQALPLPAGILPADHHVDAVGGYRRGVGAVFAPVGEDGSRDAGDHRVHYHRE
jgi:hypothetical protein